jgi:mono/diheme cytochrome c family protein
MKKYVVLLAVAAITGCTGISNQPNIELVQDMQDQPSIKAQEYDEGSPDHRGMRVPPENTVPQGFTPYKYGLDVEKASKENRNPLAGNESQEVMMTGMKYFETNCAVCHGFQGQGGEQGNSIGDKMARKPPPLISDKVKGYTDGHIYHIISKGVGVMGPYESHIPQAYRWQVVNYIRHLQKEAK